MFSVISSDDLIAASSRLTLRRARADVDMEPLRVDRGLTALTFRWSDAVCDFPTGAGLASSRCSCPARRLCRHRVRSVLYLQRDPQDDAGDWTPADIPRAQVAKAAGKTLLRQAEEALHDGLEMRRESDTAVIIPALGVRVRFLPRRPIAAALCSCGQTTLCIHRVLAALHFHPRQQTASRVDPAEAALRARVYQTARELLLVGLDGTPAEAAEGLDALSQRLSTILPAPADDLTRLSHLLADYHRRSARFSPRAWLMTVGRLMARLMALQDPGRTISPEHLRGRGRRSRLAATNLDLIGLGAEGFQGAGGSVVKCWFVLEQTGDVVSGTVGRGAIDGESPSPASLWWQPMWGTMPPAELAHARLRLPQARLSPDGSLAGATGPVQRRPKTPHPADLPDRLRIRSPASLANLWESLPPPLLRGPRQTSLPAVLVLSKEPLSSPWYHEAAQRLTLPVSLADGGVVRLEVRYGPATKRLLAVMERTTHWSAQPTHLFVRFWPTTEGFAATPIAAWLAGTDAPISLGLGDTPLQKGAPPDRRQPAPGRRPESAALRQLRELLLLLESLSVEGLGRRNRVAALVEAAAGLAGLGLQDAAEATAGLTRSPTPEGFAALLGWAGAAEEALLLAEQL